MKIKRLTPREFARAIKLGHGRAVLHVMEYGDGGVEGSIKTALVRNFVYDSMFDGLRHRWLFNIVSLTKNVNVYAEHLYRHFSSDDQSEYDLRQQFALAGKFFELGFEKFRPLMFQQFSRIETCGSVTASQFLIDTGGEAGFIQSAQTLGGIDKHLEWECSEIFKYAEDNLSFVTSEVEQLAEADSRIKKFLQQKDSLDSDTSASRRRPILEPDAFLEGVQENTISAYQARMFGKSASEKTLNTVSELLSRTNKTGEKIAYLRVFSDREMPDITEDILRLLTDRNKKLRKAAVSAVANTISPMVRNKALEILSSQKPFLITSALKLLARNYEVRDAELILQGLKALRTDDERHSAGIRLSAIVKEGGGDELAECFFWMYENGPESWCRERFLQQLINWNMSTDELLFESQWDAGYDIRRYARDKFWRGSPQSVVV